MEYESPMTSQIELNLEGLLCTSLGSDLKDDSDMTSDDLGDIFG